MAESNLTRRLKHAARVVPIERLGGLAARRDRAAAAAGLDAVAARASALVGRGRSRDAARVFANYLSQASAEDLERGAEHCRRLGVADLAADCWQRLLTADPDHLRAAIELGILDAARGDSDAAHARRAAVVAAREAGRVIEGETSVRFATLLARCGDVEAAEAELRTRLRTDPLDPRALGRLGQLVDARGDRTAARRYLGLASRVAPEDAEVRFDLGATLAASRDWDEAAEHLQAGLNLRPDCIEARYNLGAVRLAQGHFDAALVEFRRVLRRMPSHREALHASGLCYLRKGQHERAQHAFETLLASGDPDPRVHYALAVCYNALDLPRRAVATLEPMADRVPDPRRAYRLLGVCWDKLGDPDRARQAYRLAGGAAAEVASGWNE